LGRVGERGSGEVERRALGMTRPVVLRRRDHVELWVDFGSLCIMKVIKPDPPTPRKIAVKSSKPDTFTQTHHQMVSTVDRGPLLAFENMHMST